VQKQYLLDAAIPSDTVSKMSGTSAQRLEKAVFTKLGNPKAAAFFG
jgi:threonine/homoserine/homoserine lactone efflux protein